MKKVLLFLFVLVSINQAHAQTSQLLISENFTGYTNGNLNTTLSGQGGLYPWTASSNLSSDFAQIANGSQLFYAGYTSGTQYINLTAKDDYTNGTFPWFHFPDDPTRNFTGNTHVSTAAAATFYMSFVVRVPSSSGVQATNTARPELALRTSNGDNLANFYIADANSGSNLKFGIFKDGAQDGTYASGNYSFNITHLIVIRYDIVTGNNNDKMYLWVDPTVTTEPSIASANVSITSGSDGGYSGTVNEIQLFQDVNSATASLDAIKTSYATGFPSVTSNSAASWNALSPIGAPLPVKFGDIKGYKQDGGIAIEWTVYSEFNVVRYVIERSSDGVSFSAAGSVNAKNTDGTINYDWFDAAPLTGNNYYRIKNIDVDGKSLFSSVIRMSLDNSLTAGLTLYPNPVTGNHISLQSADLQRGDYKIEIFSTSGQQLYKKEFSHAGGAINQTLQLPSALQTGIYNIQLTGKGYQLAKQFLVQ